MVPEAVVEMVPVRVVDMVPDFVVEMVPPFGKQVKDKLRISNAADGMVL